MISKQIANKVKEIDFETIINSKEPGGLIKHLVLNTQDLKGDKSHYFESAAITYYCYLKDIKPSAEELNKDEHLLAWVNTCIAEPGDQNKNLLIMLAGIYQFLKWEKEL